MTLRRVRRRSAAFAASGGGRASARGPRPPPLHCDAPKGVVYSTLSSFCRRQCVSKTHDADENPSPLNNISKRSGTCRYESHQHEIAEPLLRSVLRRSQTDHIASS
ncbi:hypothetical protein EVAR_45390_1 [Eumeta japonica]|uniref:Uncharacterized protein n=1 Tax=Eumeta variegata TaxID=151549 RepID=A0A4C1WTQ7_EUMVA|nr:hypothetical protein EVAR_45390_1 [Eumeta japonica]